MRGDLAATRFLETRHGSDPAVAIDLFAFETQQTPLDHDGRLLMTAGIWEK